MLNEVSYSIKAVPERFCLSPLGRSLGVHGAEAQKLAFYLLANPYLDPQGHYALPLKAITAHTGIRSGRVKKWLQTLRLLGFCRYDVEREWVSVPLLRDMYGLEVEGIFHSQPTKESNNGTL